MTQVIALKLYTIVALLSPNKEYIYEYKKQFSISAEVTLHTSTDKSFTLTVLQLRIFIVKKIPAVILYTLQCFSIREIIASQGYP